MPAKNSISAQLDEVINRVEPPAKYAAVYARRSMKHDKNTPESQIELCGRIAKEKNLIVYGSYSDLGTSARTLPPIHREGFNKLYNDAKAGYFKTIIIWKHDRLSRNADDFYKTMGLLDELGVKVIFGDTNGLDASQPVYKSFISNLLVMIAELEPLNILEKANAGRDYLREQGIMNLSRGLFGYDVINDIDEIHNLMGANLKNNLKVNSYFKANDLMATFVKFCFRVYKSFDDRPELTNKIRRINRINELSKKLSNILTADSIVSFKEKLNSLPAEHYFEITDVLHKRVSSIDQLEENKRSAELHNLIEELRECTKYTSNFGNAQVLLTNYRYSQRHLLKANTEHKLLVYNKEEDRFEVDKDLFVPVKNGDPIIDYEDWEQVNCHLHRYTTLGKLKINDKSELLETK
jgi:site-specific DNA recombinase